MAERLEATGDEELAAVLAAAPMLGSGIGGLRQRVELGGVALFVKRIAYSDAERRVAPWGGTANLFELPLCCQYGIGSPSFGVGREVAAGRLTTQWVLEGRSASFPLLHHVRAFDHPAGPGAGHDPFAEWSDLDAFSAFWHDAPPVRRRAEAIVQATAFVALFMEFVPRSLPQWLRRRARLGPLAADDALARVERWLRTEVVAMNEAGIVHFDAHLDNLLVDDDGQFHFADLGLASSPHFALSEDEHRFLAANRSHDVAHTMTRLVDWVVSEHTERSRPSAGMELGGSIDAVARDAFIAAWAAGAPAPAGLSAGARRLLDRYAPLATIVNRFYRALRVEDRRTPYPASAIEAACLACGLRVPTLPSPGGRPGGRPVGRPG